MTLNELIETLLLMKQDGVDGDRIVIVDIEKSDDKMPHAIIQRGIMTVGTMGDDVFIRC
jgi:hypothetical protein